MFRYAFAFCICNEIVDDNFSFWDASNETVVVFDEVNPVNKTVYMTRIHTHTYTANKATLADENSCSTMSSVTDYG